MGGPDEEDHGGEKGEGGVEDSYNQHHAFVMFYYDACGGFDVSCDCVFHDNCEGFHVNCDFFKVTSMNDFDGGSGLLDNSL